MERARINWKFIAIIGLLFSAWSMMQTSCWANYTPPSYAYSIQQLAQVRQKAAARGYPVTFVYSNSNTTCNLALGATRDAVSMLASKTLVVFVESSGFNLVPEVVKKALVSPQAGKYIPKTVIVDSEFRRVVALLPYARTSTRRTMLRRILRDLPTAGRQSSNGRFRARATKAKEETESDNVKLKRNKKGVIVISNF